jgi:hypothetical protein
MTIRSIRSLVAAVLVLTAGGVARANYPHSLCRWTGIGWSDGYHSQAGCPPKGHLVHRQAAIVPAAKVKPTPWWMIPAADAEQVPAPAPAPAPPDGSSVVGPDVLRR